MREIARNTPRGRRPALRRRSRGLGLVELVVSLAIAAMLLTAVAAAYAATTSAIEMNDQFFRASQACRVSINQIMAEVRKCESGIVDTYSLEVTPPISEKRLYEFDGANNRLMLTFPDLPDSPSHALARNVQDAQFFTDGHTISMRVTVEVGTNRVTLSGSAMPRRTVTYE